MNNANWTLYEDQVLLNVASLPNIEDNNENLCEEALASLLLKVTDKVFPIKRLKKKSHLLSGGMRNVPLPLEKEINYRNLSRKTFVDVRRGK